MYQGKSNTGQWSLMSDESVPAVEISALKFVMSRSRQDELEGVTRVGVVIMLMKPAEKSLVINTYE